MSKNYILSLVEKYDLYVRNIQWHIKTNNPEKEQFKECKKQMEHYNEIIHDLKIISEMSSPSKQKGAGTWVDIINKRIKELKKIDSDFCNIRWDMSKPDYERKMARDMSNETTARRHELEDLLKTLTPESSPTNPLTGTTGTESNTVVNSGDGV